VARRYASALFAVGKKKGAADLEAYGKDLAALAEVLQGAPELVRLFKNPIIGPDDKRKVLENIAGKVVQSAVVKNFCQLLVDKGRLACLSDIEAHFHSLLDVEQGVVRGTLITAVALADAKQQEVVKSLEAKADRKLVLDFSVDSSILGGVVLKVGDKVLDASLRAQLGILKENIKRGE